jgi:hypothetical protein
LPAPNAARADKPPMAPHFTIHELTDHQPRCRRQESACAGQSETVRPRIPGRDRHRLLLVRRRARQRGHLPARLRPRARRGPAAAARSASGQGEHAGQQRHAQQQPLHWIGLLSQQTTKPTDDEANGRPRPPRTGIRHPRALYRLIGGHTIATVAPVEGDRCRLCEAPFEPPCGKRYLAPLPEKPTRSPCPPSEASPRDHAAWPCG